MVKQRKFPGPPPGQGPPLRVLPIGGLGEIGMNCMLIGVGDRYIMVDAGLMFPDFTDHGMQRILPDTAFLHQWKDKIEAVIITHAHEDHIGAMPWVVPGLDPNTPIYAASFVMELVQRRMAEYSLWNPHRFHTMEMRQRFQLGPFECEPIRVTHSIPDCCGFVLRCDKGTIVHTGDWKIDENPIDGEMFDREMFEALGREGVTLFMSDSTNVLSPGRTISESTVQQAIINRVASHNGKGRVIATQFASNLHRLASVKKAADAAGRKICFMGMSLTTYLEAAWRDGRAPFDPRILVPPSDISDYNPSEVLVVCTGSQGEERAALNRASFNAAPELKLGPSDLILFSAKVIPGNEPRVQSMMNRIAGHGADIAWGREERLHASGHAYRDELEEVLRLVKPQHFLPVHGEYAFLCEHAQLAHEAGCNFTSVIRNGQMLGVADRRNGNTLSLGWRQPQREAAAGDEAEAAAPAEQQEEEEDPFRPRSDQDAARAEAAVGVLGGAATGTLQVLGDVPLREFFNDGGKGTGTREEMDIDTRATLATEGLVVAMVDVVRQAPGNEPGAPWKMSSRVRITTRGMWVDENRLLNDLHAAASSAVAKLPPDAPLDAVDRQVTAALRTAARRYNQKRPEIIVYPHEHDPRIGAAVAAQAEARMQELQQSAAARKRQSAGGGATSERQPLRRRGRPPLKKSEQELHQQQQQQAQARQQAQEAPHNSWGGQQPAPPPSQPVPEGMLQRRRAANPREKAGQAPSDDLSFD